ncbi:MAG: phage terminase small subunit P27 family [Phycisphaerales bacterium JB039]
MAPALPEPSERISELGAEAVEKYRELARELFEMRVLTTADREALELLTVEILRYWQATEEIERDGATLTDNSGRVYRHPAQIVAKSSFASVMKLLSEFGMTPASRTAVRVTDRGGDDPKKTLQKDYIA